MMFCPWCDEGQARTWQGINAHVRAKHPDKKLELKDNKDMYLEKFACDEFGNPVGGAPDPEPTPDPEPEPDPTPAPKPKPKKKAKTKPPAPGVKPPKPEPDPTPAPKPKPAEEGGFRKGIRNLTSAVFGD